MTTEPIPDLVIEMVVDLLVCNGASKDLKFRQTLLRNLVRIIEMVFQIRIATKTIELLHFRSSHPPLRSEMENHT